jgi:probable HAF family extracellular repeat protein
MKPSALLVFTILGISICTACGGGVAGGTSGAGGGGGSTQSVATHFSVSAAATVSAGSAFNFMVDALDAANKVVATYSGSVHFTSTDTGAELPTNSTLTNGIVNFSAVLTTPGAQTITATDTASITGSSNSIQVATSQGSQLAITSGAPPNGTTGLAYGPTRIPYKCVFSPVGGFHQSCLPCIPGLATCTGLPPCQGLFPSPCTKTILGFEFTASGGVPPNTWIWAPAMGSSIPPGLTLSQYGIISGTPTAQGTYVVSVTVRAPGQTPASKTFTITIKATGAADAAFLSKVDAPSKHHHYKLVDLGSTFGGPQSYLVPGSGIDFTGSSVLNSAGRMVGYADTSEPDPFPNICFWDCDVVHAFRAGNGGHLTDLGSLPGGGSSVPMWITANGLIAGLSENGETDPLYPGLPQLRAVLWQHDRITDLGTLPGGGYQSVATAMNSSGQVVGAALNTIPDANSMQQAPIGPGAFWLWSGITPPYLYQMRAFLWDKQNGMQDLGTLPGGTDAQAIMINESGQVIGFSYTASTEPGACFALATSSFIWEKGKGMTDLGSLGGTCTLAAALNSKGQVVGEALRTGDQSAPAFLWEKGLIRELGGSLGGDASGAFAINDLGEAVGFGNLPGNNTFHATLWKNANTITDLGAIGSDECSFAGAINASGQIVGSSLSNCDGDTGIVRAILYDDGSLFDLNALIPADSALSLQYAHAINDRGEISGTAVDANGNAHAFLLISCDENHHDIEDCNREEADSSSKPDASVPKPRQVRPGRSTFPYRNP